MSVRSVPLSAMFGWVVDGFRMFGRSFSSQVGASALMLLLVVAMCLPMWVVMFMTMGNAVAGGMPVGQSPLVGHMGLFVGMYAVTLVLSIALFPPMVAGWFRMDRGIDRGDVVGATSILAPYRDSALWLRSIGFALLAFVIYLAIFGLLALAFYGSINEFMQLMQTQQAAALAGVPPPPPHFPAGLVIGYFLMIVIGSFLQLVYLVGFADLALQGTGAVEAMTRAARATFKNIVMLAIFTICLFVAAFFAFMLLGIVIALLMVVLSMLIKWLALVVIMVIYIAFLLCIYPLMFAINYQAWKSMLGDDATVPLSA